MKLNQKNLNSDISSKIVNRNPSGPFTTSTLQQVSSGKLGFGASRTMQIAQKLYQGIEIEGETIGLITYMRTDGTNISSDAIDSFRNYIKMNLVNDYLPEKTFKLFWKKSKKCSRSSRSYKTY